MAATKTKRAATKINQFVMRLTDERLQRLKDMVAWSGYDVKRTAVVERAIDELHERMRKAKR